MKYEIPAGYRIVKDNEIIPKGSYYISHKFLNGSNDLLNWKKDNVTIGMKRNPNWFVSIAKEEQEKKMEYPTTITWNGINYVAPEGYYFLEAENEIEKGDGYFDGHEVRIYEIILHLKVQVYYTYPSVRPIPVEKVAPVKLQYKLITDIQVGDVFVSKEQGANSGAVIIQGDWHKELYSLSGRNGLNNYSNSQSVTKEEMIEYLNEYGKIFITNINDKINKTILAGLKMI